MKEQFEEVVIEIVRFDSIDVICYSEGEINLKD